MMGFLLLLWHAACYVSLLIFCFLQFLRWNLTHHPTLLEVCWQGWSINGFLLKSWPFFFLRMIQAQDKGPVLYIYILRYSVYVYVCLCIHHVYDIKYTLRCHRFLQRDDPLTAPGETWSWKQFFLVLKPRHLGCFYIASNLQELHCWKLRYPLPTAFWVDDGPNFPLGPTDWFPWTVAHKYYRFLSPIKFSKKLPYEKIIDVRFAGLIYFKLPKHLHFSPGSSFRFGWFDPRPSVVFWGNHHRGSMPTFGASEDFGCFVVWDPQGFRGAGTGAAWGFFAFSWLLLITPISCLMQR